MIWFVFSNIKCQPILVLSITDYKLCSSQLRIKCNIIL